MTRITLYLASVLVLTGCTSTTERFIRPAVASNAAGLRTDCATATVVGLRWDAPPGRVTRYEISRDGVPLAATGRTFFADTTVSESTHYSYSVSALNGHGATPTLPAPEGALFPPPGTALNSFNLVRLHFNMTGAK